MERSIWCSRLAAAGIVVAALLPAAPAEAAVKKVWPASFHAIRPGHCVNDSYLGVQDGYPDETCIFFSQVQLPVGSKVQKIEYLYSSTAVVSTQVFLETAFFGGNPVGQEEWTGASDIANTGGATKTVEGNIFEFGNHKLKKGEMVHVWAVIRAPNARFFGVKIYFQ